MKLPHNSALAGIHVKVVLLMNIEGGLGQHTGQPASLDSVI
jgi:hypothetical protein